MTTSATPVIGASSAYPMKWSAIDWRTVKSHVRRLQMLIAKAIREKRYGKLRLYSGFSRIRFMPSSWRLNEPLKIVGGRPPG